MRAAVVAAVVLAFVAGAYAVTDDCSSFPDCTSCLFSAPGKHRANCGWCHSDVQYKNGTIGHQCADIRDSPWHCPSVYDTYSCSQGYACNYTTAQCYIDPSAGSGLYPSQSECKEHCFKTPSTYICNTTTYQCIECSPGQPNCGPKSEACDNCTPPPGATFTCDRSDPKNPKCAQCHVHSSKNCTDFHTACDDCQTPKPPPPGPHPPPPPPSPPGPHPPPPPATLYSCDPTTMQCVQNKTGTVQQACSARCGNHTPPELQFKTFRGIMVSQNFDMGEYDLNFTASALLFKTPDGSVYHALVQMVNDLQFVWQDGPNAGKTQRGLMQSISNGPETTGYMLALGAPGGPAPAGLPQAMNGTDGATAWVLNECNNWKAGVCDFTSVFNAVAARLLSDRPNLAADIRRAAAARWGASAPELDDPCNQYLNCSQCIGTHGSVSCGWCLGGQIIYNSTGLSQFKCAGFQSGQPKDFTCTRDFRTEDCSGISCNWTSAQPKCYKSDDGSYDDMQTCEDNCKAAEFARCNTQTKQCEICHGQNSTCTQTLPQCQATCGAQRAKCNIETKQCVPCDPSSDPDCVDTQGACETKCKKQSSYGVCDPTTGQCVPCEPSSKEPGCVSSCNATCSFGGQYSCNVTDHTCFQNPAGNMSLPTCAEDCIPHNHTTGKYGCVWGAGGQPQCVEGKGTLDLKDCQHNCQQPQFARCNYTSGQCQTCKPGESPSCRYTQAYCNASCHASEIVGVYRGIEISQGFKRGEWDFSFYDDGNVAFTEFGSGARYEAKFSLVGPATQGAPISFEITEAPSSGPFPVQPGDTLQGLYVSNAGQSQLTTFVYLGMGTDTEAVTTFDQGMTALEFVLTGCAPTDKGCDFSKAAQPE